MKILILIFLFVLGCGEKNRLNELEDGLYEMNEVYVLMNQDEVHGILGVKKEDYEDCLALKTLVFYEQKEIFIFYNANDSLKNKIELLKNENYVVFEMNHYFYYGANDLDVITYIKDTLNK